VCVRARVCVSACCMCCCASTFFKKTVHYGAALSLLSGSMLFIYFCPGETGEEKLVAFF